MAYSLPDFTRFAAKLKTEAGKPLRLSEFQKGVLRPYFAGTQQTVIVLPTGNGKTTLMAAVGLYHFLRVPNAQVLIVASAEEQAATLFKQMRTLAAESAYADLIDVKGGRFAIYHKGEGPNRRPPGEIRVIASEVRRQEGAIPTLVLVDELHAHKNLQMYEMLRDKLWKRGAEPGCGRMVAISTAGFSFDSPLFKLKRTAEQMPTFRREGFCNRASSSALEWFEYALDPDQDRGDVRLVAKVNPAPWITQKVLRQRLADPFLSPGEWARSACNVWTAGEDPAILPEEWDRLAVDIGRVEPGEDVFLAPSVGGNAAVAVAAARPDGRVAIHVEHLDMPTDDSILRRTEDLIVNLCGFNRDYTGPTYHVLEARLPLAGFRRSTELLEARGVPVVEDPHSPVRLAEFTGSFERMLRAGLLMHDGDPVTRTQVLAATKKVTETGERYMESVNARAIGAILGAVHAATAYDGGPIRMVLPTGVG